MKNNKFEQAGKVFRSLVNEANNTKIGDYVRVPKNSDGLFGIAALAVAALNDLGAERIEPYEKELFGPFNLTVLCSANMILANYFLRDITQFDRDDYEMLERVCYSAQILYDKGIIRCF
ncbi:MAG: hypothetical protein ACPLXC_01065 [Candidatus Pacearchaeota archaeon]